MGFGGGGVPEGTDDIIQQQTALNREAAERLGFLNREDVVTPFGSLRFTPIGTGAERRFLRTETLAPGDLANLDRQRQLLASGLGFGQESLAQLQARGPFDPAQLGAGAPGLVSDLGDFQQRGLDVEESIFNRQAGRIDEDFDQQRVRLETQLTQQGLPIGSRAREEAIRRLERNRQDALDVARTSAIGQGMQASGQLFQQDLAGANLANLARQQAIQEQIGGRQVPLGEIATLLGFPQPQLPTFGGGGAQVGFQPANVAQAAQVSRPDTSLQTGLFGLGGSLLGAAGGEAVRRFF